MKEFEENNSVEMLQTITERYPYFTAANFFLAKKLKKENAPSFLKQVQKAVLFFPNPYWLHYQLLQENYFDRKKQIAPQPQPQSVSEDAAQEIISKKEFTNNSNPKLIILKEDDYFLEKKLKIFFRKMILLMKSLNKQQHIKAFLKIFCSR